MHVGLEHEKRSQTELEQRGWSVDPFGQGLFSDEIRTALQSRHPVVQWRWIPDLIASRGRSVCLVDPKWDTRPDTAYFAIEQAALMAHAAMSMLGLRIVYVFGDLTCNCHEDIRVVEWIGPAPGGRRIATRGSGTPMALVLKSDQHPLDALFGPVLL